MTDLHEAPRASFTDMSTSTKEDWMVIMGQRTELEQALPDRIIEQFDSLLLEDFQQEFELKFVDESYSFFPYELILPCTRDGLTLCDDFTDFPRPEGRIVAGFDVGRTHDRSELAVFEERAGTGAGG
jgi:hypothetical protein